MAFMMPVMKNEWDIYKTNRSRRSSECSNPQACRSRKVSGLSVTNPPETEPTQSKETERVARSGNTKLARNFVRTMCIRFSISLQ